MKHTLFLLFISLLLLHSCNSDLADDPSTSGDSITIRLRLMASGGSSRLGTYGDWNYDAGSEADDERIQNGFSVMVNDKGVVEHILRCGHTGQNLEEDFLECADGKQEDGAVLIPTTVGMKRFYTFANLTQDEVEAAIGNDFHFVVGEAIDTARVSRAAISVSGDGFRPTRTHGIPMTGSHPLALSQKDNGQERDLYVVRLLAKLQFNITNNTGEALTVNDITVSALTQNPANGAQNLRLFPSPYTPSGLPLTLEPNLTEQAVQADRTFSVDKTLSNGGKATLTAYVNETAYPQNAFGQFMLTVNLTKADGTTKQQRYALVSNDNNAWDYIARNDWRIIPLVLQDYKLNLIPRDYPPIGVLPCSVKGDEGTFTCIFHADGDFHLMPQVSRYSTGAVVDNWTGSNVVWETLQDNPTLYDQTPEWYETGGYVHGRFNLGARGRSRHVLTLTVKPENGVARRFTCPVIIVRE